MDKKLLILCFLLCLAMSLIAFPEGAVASLLTAVCSGFVILILYKYFRDDAKYLTEVFLIALFARLLFGLFLEVSDLRLFFGGDATTYDFLGNRMTEVWFGTAKMDDFYTQRALKMDSGWGMNYLVGFLYLFTGRSLLTAQSFCAVVGAATAPMIYKCATDMVGNQRVGRVAALLVALYPAFIVWTGQLLKDGIIIFLLVLIITLVLQLQKKFTWGSILLLAFSLFGILALRFYIFYMVIIAVIGALIIGHNGSGKVILRRSAMILVIGLGLTYVGVLKNASGDLDKYANLERIQESRLDLAKQGSGYGQDIDVSTTEGALTVLPIGFVYLMLAPFPWQVTNVRQAITVPEIMLWWASIPFLIIGFWYTIKHRLRASVGMLMFTSMLTIAYSLFQGNVGTAYRQRTQIQVFMFIFIAVGWVYVQEKREQRKAIESARRNEALKHKVYVNA